MKAFNLKTLLFSLTVLFSGSLLFTSCEPDDTPNIPTNLTETLKEDAEFSDLINALELTNLTSQLDGATITLFAPTNAAFSTFLSNGGVYASLSELYEAEPDVLKNLLLNHVVDGYFSSSDLSNSYYNTAATVQDFYNPSLKVDIDNELLNNTAKITTPDIDGLTGIIHKVNAVIDIPDVVDLVNNDGKFSSLVQSLATADLVNALQADGPFTVFAPVNDAIQWSTSMNLPLNLLEEILLDHVVDGNFRAADLTDGMLIDSYGMDATNTYSILFDTDGVVKIIETDSNPTRIIAKVLMADIQGKNGVVHIIDNVIVL